MIQDSRIISSILEIEPTPHTEQEIFLEPLLIIIFILILILIQPIPERSRLTLASRIQALREQILI